MTNNVEFETAKIRNIILAQYFPEYAKGLREALLYASSDPPAGLLKSRQILEDICRKIWSENYDSAPPSIFEIFNDDTIKSFTPKRLLNRIHSLRSICNIAVHGDPVTGDDVIMSLNHLFMILEWYGTRFKNLDEFPTAIQPPHSFIRYLKDCLADKLFVFVMGINTAFSTLLFTYHHKFFPSKIDRIINTAYEGIFTNPAISFIYGLILIFITLSVAWIIFKRFREQDFESRLLSFQLMYAMIFLMQYILLHVGDFYTGWF